MWVHTAHGFYSAVAHRDRPGYLMIRGRCRRDLEVLRHRHPALLRNVKIKQTDKADYPWRIVIEATTWAEIMSLESTEIDYDNFKSAIDRTIGKRRHDILLRVWRNLMDIEVDDRIPDRPLGAKPPKAKKGKGRKAGESRYGDAWLDQVMPRSHYDQPLHSLTKSERYHPSNTEVFRSSTLPDRSTPMLDEIRFSDDCRCFEPNGPTWVPCPVHES